MPEDIEVNKNYCYDSQDIAQLTFMYQSKEKNPNNLWGQPIGFNGVENPLELADYNLKQACENLKPNQKLLLPLNLQKAYHWVGAIIEKAKGGFRITTMDSLDGHETEIQETVHKISEALGPEHQVTISQASTETTLKQHDKVSCGPFVMQNLTNQANPKKAVELQSPDIRKIHIELAGDNFSKKQELNLENKTTSSEQLSLWETIIATQMDEIQNLIPQAQERKEYLEEHNNSFETALDHLLEHSEDKNKVLKQMYQDFPKQKELLDDIKYNLTPLSNSQHLIEPSVFEKALDHALNIEDELVKRLKLQGMQDQFPKQRKFLDEITKSIRPELNKRPSINHLPYNLKHKTKRGRTGV